MTLYEIEAPDGRRIRQYSNGSSSEVQTALMPGYKVKGTVSLADDRGEGGFLCPLNGKTLMGALLDAHGDELVAWLKGKL